MPYTVEREHSGKYNVVNQESHKVMGAHPTRRQAIGQLRALYANEPGASLKKRMNEPVNPKLWEQAIAEAKKKFNVYPSAYANMWANSWYKQHGGEWVKSDLKQKSDEMNGKKDKQKPTQSHQNDSAGLAPFERYVDPSDKESSSSGADSTEDKTVEKTKGKEKHYWLREQYVDVTRPVIDEAGHVIGFHPCGRNSKEVSDHNERYRTSYPMCMPRSKAMHLNAMQREQYIQSRKRYAPQPDEENSTSEMQGAPDEQD